MAWIKKRYVDQIRYGMLMLQWVIIIGMTCNIVMGMCRFNAYVDMEASVRESLFMVVFVQAFISFVDNLHCKGAMNFRIVLGHHV